MKILLDTHVLIQILNGDETLNKKIIRHIDNPVNLKFVSVVSFWEIAIKVSLNKLAIKGSITDLWELSIANGLRILMINNLHLSKLMELPFIHHDPFDRLIISQALTENLELVTDDKQISRYPLLKLFKS